jgi:hypothetical protein
MSSTSDDDHPVMRSSTERYDRVGSDLDWFLLLGTASSIFFGFLLDIAINPPSYFTYFDNLILLAALYAVTVAVSMFMASVIYHTGHYLKFNVERFLFRTKLYGRIGIASVMIAMYLGLGLALNSKLSFEIAFAVASSPFVIIILFRSFERTGE